MQSCISAYELRGPFVLSCFWRLLICKIDGIKMLAKWKLKFTLFILRQIWSAQKTWRQKVSKVKIDEGKMSHIIKKCHIQSYSYVPQISSIFFVFISFLTVIPPNHRLPQSILFYWLPTCSYLTQVATKALTPKSSKPSSHSSKLLLCQLADSQKQKGTLLLHYTCGQRVICTIMAHSIFIDKKRKLLTTDHLVPKSAHK